MQRYSLLLLLFLVCQIVYLPGLLHHGFVNWDDPMYIIDNPLVKGITTEHLRLAFTTSYFSNYAPLHLISYMIDFHLWGNWAPGYLLENSVIHGINGLLIFILLERLTGSRRGAFLGALIFLIHPVQVESVAWASQRKNLLAMLFFLTAFHAYLEFDRFGWRDGWGKFLVALLMFGCALLTKPVTIILPVLLLLYDQLLGRGTDRKWKLLEKLPFAAMTLVGALLTVAAQDPSLHGGQGGLYDIFKGDRLSAFLTMATVLFSYLRILLFPYGLCILYDPPIKNSIDADVAASLIGLLVLFILFVIAWRSWRGAAFWGGVFMLGLLPVLQIIPLLTLMNDRYLYFPMIGVAGGIAAMFGHVAPKGERYRVILTSLLLVYAVILTGASIERIKIWKDSLSLWNDAVIKSPSVPGVWVSLGEVQRDRGDLDGGRVSLGKAMEMIPKSYAPLYQMARLETKADNREKALELLEKAIRLGFADKSDLESEADFAPLRTEPDFIRLMRYFHYIRIMPTARLPDRNGSDAFQQTTAP